MTSNDVSQLPPELSRTGRIDALWYFSLPTQEEREDIFRIHFSKNKKEVSMETIERAAAEAKNFTGAEIEESVKSSIRKSFKRYMTTDDKSKEIKEEEILEAIKEIVPIYKSSSEKINMLEAWADGRARKTQDDDLLIRESDSNLLDEMLNNLEL